MGITKNRFGKTKNGEEAMLYTLVNQAGMGIEVTNYGATLVSVTTADSNGKFDDVVLGYDDVIDYCDNNGYFGAAIGRNGNRIKGATVTIGEKEYSLSKNENNNSLHSGPHGFDKVIWETSISDTELAVTFTYRSPDGDQGFPGNFDVKITYSLSEDNEVVIHYVGVSDKDTIANVTNHSYFNLSGNGAISVEEHQVQIMADTFTVVDKESIPTGELRPVQGTPMDFRTAKRIGQDIEQGYEQLSLASGYDHNFVLNNQNGKIRKCAVVCEETTGRMMEVYTDCVGLQFYTGNKISDRFGKNGVSYTNRSGFCMETQYYPDCNHQVEFPSSILKAGEIYDTTTIYKFMVKS